MKLNKKCTICGQDKDWIDVDYLRKEPQKMVVCEQCGFITFDRFSNVDEYESYYESDYRSGTVNISNLVTTNRKLGYHEIFIGEHLKKNKDLSICDIGAGIGYFLRWARDRYNHKNITGVELDLNMRRYAQNAFDIPLTKHFDTSKKYDLICMYHSIEHLPNPAKMLNDIKNCLNENGLLYVATPVWMEEMYNFGGMPFNTFDEHFHENHVNAWSKKHFKYFMSKNGWKITKQNHKSYGYTMLCEPKTPSIFRYYDEGETGKDVEFQLQTMQKAAVAYKKGDFREAIRLYPQFVDAYLAEIGRQNNDFGQQIRLCDVGINTCPNVLMFNSQKGMLYFQREMLQEAEKELLEVSKFKSCDDNVLLHLGLIALKNGEKLLNIPEKKEEGKKILQYACKLFDQIIQINPKNFGQCFDYIGYILSKIPLKDEKEIKFSQPSVKNAPQVTFGDQNER